MLANFSGQAAGYEPESRKIGNSALCVLGDTGLRRYDGALFSGMTVLQFEGRITRAGFWEGGAYRFPPQ